jgi:phosphoribosylglycinamide formyltransferase 1
MIGVLVSGEGTNLQALLDAGLPVAAVASNVPDVPALERARAVGVPTGVFPLADHGSREERDRSMAEWLEGHDVHLVVCAGYMQLLTPAFLERFPAMNVHPSLLPAFPGLQAVEEALAAGVAETGATVHFLDEGIDTGPVIAQEAVRVLPGDTPETLHARIQEVEHRLLPEAARLYLNGRLQASNRLGVD